MSANWELKQSLSMHF